ncbi:MAG: NADP-dependent phosphogluconate dehydrogenase [Anaerolineaceae bacterium]|nr:NADP-dependent phosphogluconate dehydrogenase [Anaerolineaceae bacterium]
MIQSQISVIGLGVMGSNLALNFERNGFAVSVYNRSTSKMQELIASLPEGTRLQGFETLPELVNSLEKPRRILIMVAAGAPVDAVIQQLTPLLDKGDILIDGGNSFYQDSTRRAQELEQAGLNYLGMGISGGEEGALWGPSLMPGGHFAGWVAMEPMLRAVAARAEDGEPCVAYIGAGGAGHYVKMVHNGIEYGDMQLIAEIYDLLHRGLGIKPAELASIFAEWNEGVLRSYLIEITAGIFKYIDKETGQPIVDLILDDAQQKGTGKWTSQDALDTGAPIPTINAAVESRLLSALKTERFTASKLLRGPNQHFTGNTSMIIQAACQALYASKITSYAQGFSLLRMASQLNSFNLKYGEIASIWRAGCIIRATLLDKITQAYQRDPALPNLLLDEYFLEAVNSRQDGWRKIVQMGVELGIPMLATGASLAYFDAYRSARLPANLTQAQRDFFGAHTYRRVDREGVFHTEWSSG